MGLIITLLIAGGILLLLETFLPGMVAGVAGLICVGWGVGLSYTRFGVTTGNIVSIIVFAVLTAGTLIWIKLLPSSPLARLFMSSRTIGTVAASRPELLNQQGVAHSPLRPSGIAVINGRRVDVVSEGAMIEPGTPVKVVHVEGLRVVVRAL